MLVQELRTLSLSLLSASDKIFIVLINEPTSFTDAFTLIKVCHLEFGLMRILSSC